MEIPSSKLTRVKTPLIGIKSSSVPMKGALKLLVVMGTPLKCVSLQQSFIVIKMALAYKFILGRPLLYQINVVISTWYLALKFPT